MVRRGERACNSARTWRGTRARPVHAAGSPRTQLSGTPGNSAGRRSGVRAAAPPPIFRPAGPIAPRHGCIAQSNRCSWFWRDVMLMHSEFVAHSVRQTHVVRASVSMRNVRAPTRQFSSHLGACMNRHRTSIDPHQQAKCPGSLSGLALPTKLSAASPPPHSS